MKPIDAFIHAADRALFMVDLHDVLQNTKRPVKDSVAKRYRELLGWEQNDTVLRIGNKNGVLVVRNHASLTEDSFTSDTLSSLLRGGLVGGVSALDRFMHDLIVYHSLTLLRRQAAAVPKELLRFRITLADAEAAIGHAIRDRSKSTQHSRPRTTLKERFRTALHEKTFQSSRGLEEAFSLLGVAKCWSLIETKVTGRAATLKSRLDRIVRRRNQIVHEGDVVRAARPRTVKLHPIKASDVRDDLLWLKQLATAIDEIVEAEV